MIDDIALVRTFLLADTALAALVGTRIYGNRQDTPQGYTPAGDGPAIVFFRRGGQGSDEERSTVHRSYTFKCYAATALAADQLYRALYDALDRGSSYAIVDAKEEAPGTLLEEPGTLWFYSRSNFAARLRVAA